MQRLSDEQRRIVSENLDIVSIVLRKYIHTNSSVRGLEWDDLYQCGCIGMCKAAVTYNGSCDFKTFAFAVVKNELLDVCRRLQTQWRNMPTLLLSEAVPDSADITYLDVLAAPGNDFRDKESEMEINLQFAEIKKHHNGTVLKGIHALELRYRGYTGLDIAAIYKVEPKLVFSWISKAKQKLKATNELNLLLNSCK